MDFYSYYLPQFHEIPENNEWWGKGFTEWTNVKKAKKLFRKHVQPQVPLNNNYYNLLDPKTLRWQADLAKAYGLKGFIFYHYYFNGKKLLEKPAELILKNRDIDTNFFFCWANHNWNRAWRNSKEILIEQTYGNKSSWKEHFEYLLSFFMDDRYVKIDNKPVLMLFNPIFEEKNNILNYFNTLCKANGFNGIYVIESDNNYNKLSIIENNISDCSTVIARREPDYSYNKYMSNKIFFCKAVYKLKRVLVEMGLKCFVKKIVGDKIYSVMNESINDKSNNCSIVPGIFFSWDNTPRHSERGYVISPISKQTFFEHMDRIKEKKCDMVFVNAWNEWAEGMMLEPTEADGCKYLEWIKEWKDNYDSVDKV